MNLEQIRAKAQRELQGHTAVPLFAAGLCGIGVWVKDDPTRFGLAPAANGLDHYKDLVHLRRVLLVRSLMWSIRHRGLYREHNQQRSTER